MSLNATADVADEHFEVLIVGAGVSGIGAAYHLRHDVGKRSFVVLDAQPSFGGTWLTQGFPGIRSDSDLYTFGYRFKPWVGPPIATAADIRRYMAEVVEDNDLAPHIRFGHAITEASWNGADRVWTVTARRAETGEVVRFTASFLFMCQGYFRHREGHMPQWPGMDDFQGEIVHAQTWPEDLDVSGRNVVVIGSGATAATIVPNIAGRCAHVTMLQRSPTYFVYSANANVLADRLRELQIDENWIHEIVRRDILDQEAAFSRRCVEEPEVVRAELLAAVAEIVGPELTDKHFTPQYRPWQQRIAFLPDADLLHAIRDGRASVTTGEIECFTPTGVRLTSGDELPADIVVAATGFNMNILGDIAFTVDGAPLDLSKSVTYRGMMFTGVPNLAWVFGYFRSSWTLRSDLLSDFVCRLLEHMDAHRRRKVEVVLPPALEGRPRLPWIDPENFNPGYLQRALPLLPRRLDHPDWQHTQDYALEKDVIPAIDLEGPEFAYDRPAARVAPAAEAAE